MLVRSGTIVIKYWFSITDDEQQFRFLMRIHDPLKQWKLSPMASRMVTTLISFPAACQPPSSRSPPSTGPIKAMRC